MTNVTAIARIIHEWQTMDGPHGKFTARCLCNTWAEKFAIHFYDPEQERLAAIGAAVERLPEGTTLSYIGGRLHVHGDSETDYDETDYMCPNCLTPWKCNGPHLNDQTPAAIAAALDTD